MLHHLDDVGVVLVVDRHAEERLEVLFQGEVDHHLGGRNASGGGELGDALVAAVGAGHDEHPVPVGRVDGGAVALVAFAGVARHGHELGFERRIGELRALLGQRQLADVAPDFPGIEGQVRFEGVDDAERARVHLREHRTARLRHLVEQGEVAAPDLGRTTIREQAPRHGHAGFHGQVLQPQVVLADLVRVSADGLAGNLEHAGAGATHGVDDRADLVPGRQAARHRLVVRRLVVGGARCGEADGAGTHGLDGEGGHALDVVFAGLLLEGARAHDVGA